MNKMPAGNLLAVVLLVSLLAFGCAPQSNGDRPATYDVTGIVTHNGQPVEGATVSFQPTGTGTAAIGKTDASGKYTLTTFASGDGALPGEYQVKIVKLDVKIAETVDEDSEGYEAPAEGETVAAPENLLPESYADPATSGLTATVTEDESQNTFDFALEG